MTQPKTHSGSVTVIVPVRNEAKNIPGCMEALCNQQYQAGEWCIMMVDDHSDDETWARLQAYRNREQVKLIQLPSGAEGKKAALQHAILQAGSEWIVTTDADCRMGPHWLTTLLSVADADTGVICGPVSMKDAGTAFTSLQALEFSGLIATGAAAIASGHPTLANGANFAFRRTAWTQAGGYGERMRHPSGDDEFLLHAISGSGKWKAAFAWNPDAIVTTEACGDWTTFCEQRKRWVSKSRMYERRSISYTLSVIWAGMWFLPAAAAVACFRPEMVLVVSGAILLKILSEASVLIPAANFFGNLHLLVWLVPESMLHVIYVIWIGIAGNLGTFTWKGRQRDV